MKKGLLVARPGLRLAALTVAAVLAPRSAGAVGFRIFHSTAVLDRDPGAARPEEFGLWESSAPALAASHPAKEDFRLDLQFPIPPTIAPDAGLGSPAFAPPTRQPKRFWIGATSAAAVLGSAYNAFSEYPNYDFHFTQEGWFGQSTYAGGGDKASHFVSFYGVTRLMTAVYELLDASREQSYRLATGVSFLAGLATEIGDGTNKYGFSYEDLVLDAIGAASAYVLARYDLDDLIGFRAGVVPAPETPPEYYDPTGTGKDYTTEIYTADLKLAGLARRLDRRFGPARFLLLSLTYSAKGYPYAVPELKERQVGLEVGLNVVEAARAIGVPENRWWGKMLLTILDLLRLPYTAIGVRYDLNHGRWIGPDSGGSFEFPTP
ncbi:MAG: DUF2279 domain-containing protein [Thermoanaerobaculia bacterium]